MKEMSKNTELSDNHRDDHKKWIKCLNGTCEY